MSNSCYNPFIYSIYSVSLLFARSIAIDTCVTETCNFFLHFQEKFKREFGECAHCGKCHVLFGGKGHNANNAAVTSSVNGQRRTRRGQSCTFFEDGVSLHHSRATTPLRKASSTMLNNGHINVKVENPKEITAFLD